MSTISKKAKRSGTAEILHVDEAPTDLVKCLHQGYTGELITQYTPYLHREAHETLSKGGMTLDHPGMDTALKLSSCFALEECYFFLVVPSGSPRTIEPNQIVINVVIDIVIVIVVVIVVVDIVVVIIIVAEC